MTARRIFAAITISFLISCSAPGHNENTIVSIKTTLGDIKVRLYNETPGHRDNFVKLVNSGFYDGIAFHRVIREFMAQAGDPQTNPALSSIPDSLKRYTIPAEFNPSFFHKKGALAAARQGNNVNPEMKSSGTQFYIVQGKKWTDAELAQAEQLINNNIKQAVFTKYVFQIADSAKKAGNTLTDSEIQEKATIRMFDYLTKSPAYKITEEQKNIYRTIGGTPLLDGTYTVFGEVIEGIDVVDRIATVPTGPGDRPVSEVKIIKMKVEGR
ncbi:MAG: peptidylprolyl isomerase [Bacteroidales bacterium]|jgi:cyclophilin family peptidyl-prolyl cis-trans isomerase|nr:peptidylprolyl isomerase [Bacteroidales bacterium]MCU0408548.1 peptidylprolyl isomerase [Bacteroidales bacterium]